MVTDVLAAHPEILGVYSMYAYGADRIIIDAFAAVDRPCRVFIAHDLDEDHLKLLVDGKVSALLHHDLREDMRHACQIIMQENGALPGRPVSAFSAVQVVTPFNVPPHKIS